MTDGYFVPANLWPFLRNLIRDYRSGKIGGDPNGEEAPDESWRSPVLVCLLEDLESDQVANAVTLARDHALPTTFDVSILGKIQDTDATIQLKIKRDQEEETQTETSEEIPWDATAKEVRDLIAGMAAFRGYKLSVTLGKHTKGEDEYSIGRWLISTNNLKASFSTPTVNASSATDCVVKKCRLRSTGHILKVMTAIPVGDPSPLRAGAICWATPVDGFGYAVMSAEPRFFSVEVTPE